LVLKDSSDNEDAEYTLKLDVKGEKEIKAGDIVCPDMVEVVNKDLVLCHLASTGHIKMELFARKGRGFVTAEENKVGLNIIGQIPVDSSFSPIEKVEIKVDPTRVGHDARYEKLTLNVRTNGSTNPQDAVALAAKILDEHLKLFEELDAAVKSATFMADNVEKPESKFTTMSLEELDLSVRSFNCLKRNGLKTVQDLCNMKESELMTVRNLGKKSYKEIIDKLAEFGLGLQHDDVKK
jgi:DNA-directed RNA polymerase subunit alpha